MNGIKDWEFEITECIIMFDVQYKKAVKFNSKGLTLLHENWGVLTF